MNNQKTNPSQRGLNPSQRGLNPPQTGLNPPSQTGMNPPQGGLTVGVIGVIGETAAVASPYNPGFVAAMRIIPGAEFHYFPGKVWTFPVSELPKVEAAIAKNYPVADTLERKKAIQELIEWANEMGPKNASPEQIKALEALIEEIPELDKMLDAESAERDRVRMEEYDRKRRQKENNPDTPTPSGI